MIAPNSILVQYELNYNPTFVCRDDADAAETMISGPREKVVDLVDWSSATMGETMSVQMQVHYMFLRVVDTLRGVFGDKGFEALSRVDLTCNTGVQLWIDTCQDALSRLAAVLCCLMAKPMEKEFMSAWCVIPETFGCNEWDRFGCVRECFRVIIRFERWMQLERLNQMVVRLAPRVQTTRGVAVLVWFRSQVGAGAINTCHALAWMRRVAETWKDDPTRPMTGDAPGDMTRMMQCGLAALICRLPLFAGTMPETLMFDRARLQADYLEFETIVAMLAMADFARDWAVFALKTHEAVAFLNALDALQVDVTTADEYSESIIALRNETLADIPDRVDDSFLFFREQGVRPLRSSYHLIVLGALLGASQHYGCMLEDTDSIQDKMLPVAPVFLPRIQALCSSVYRTSSAHLRVFMPVYEELLVSVVKIDDVNQHGCEKRKSALCWLPAIGKWCAALFTGEKIKI